MIKLKGSGEIDAQRKEALKTFAKEIHHLRAVGEGVFAVLKDKIKRGVEELCHFPFLRKSPSLLRCAMCCGCLSAYFCGSLTMVKAGESKIQRNRASLAGKAVKFSMAATFGDECPLLDRPLRKVPR
ncbi:MAG: hypothetical protein QXY83_01095 [Thermosphaera sp.]